MRAIFVQTAHQIEGAAFSRCSSGSPLIYINDVDLSLHGTTMSSPANLDALASRAEHLWVVNHQSRFMSSSAD